MVNQNFSWEDLNKENNFELLAQEDTRLEEANEKEIIYRINDIRYTFESYLELGQKISHTGITYISSNTTVYKIIDSSELCRQHLKVIKYWLMVCKWLLEYRQVTPEFLEKMIIFVSHILGAKEDSQYSAKDVIALSNNEGNFAWVRALLELAKIYNKDQIKLLKEVALEILVLVTYIKTSVQIISYFVVAANNDTTK